MVQFHAFLTLVWQYLPDSPSAVAAALDLVLGRKGIGAEALAAEPTDVANAARLWAICTVVLLQFFQASPSSSKWKCLAWRWLHSKGKYRG